MKRFKKFLCKQWFSILVDVVFGASLGVMLSDWFHCTRYGVVFWLLTVLIPMGVITMDYLLMDKFDEI